MKPPAAPPTPLTREEKAVVQPVRAPLPELDALSMQAEAAPEIGQRHFPALEPCLDLAHPPNQRLTLLEGLALMRRPRADLAPAGASAEVGS